MSDVKRQQFKDAQGRVWTLRINCLVVEQFEQKTGLSPFAESFYGQIAATMKISTLLWLAWFSCKGQNKVSTFEEFAASLETEEQMEAMTFATVEALRLFSRNRDKIAVPQPENK